MFVRPARPRQTGYARATAVPLPAPRRCQPRCAGRRDGAGAPVSGSPPDAVFGKAMTSRMESAPAKQCNESVEAEGDPAVRRRAVLEGLEQESELAFGLLVAEADDVEDAALDVGAGGYGSTRRRSRSRSGRCRRRRPAPRQAACRSCPRTPRRGEVNGWWTAVQPVARSSSILEHGGVDHPDELPAGRGRPVHSAARSPAAPRRAGRCLGAFARCEEDRVARTGPRLRRRGRTFFGRTSS